MVKVRRVRRVIRTMRPLKDDEAGLPMEYVSVETFCVPEGHGTEYIYVVNQKNINKFGKVGSY